jgi:hypothetical protein
MQNYVATTKIDIVGRFARRLAGYPNEQKTQDSALLFAGPAGEDGGGQSAARSELAANDAPFGARGLDDINEDFVHGVFIKNSQITVCQEIHFQGFELEAFFGGHVAYGDDSEIGQTGFGADGGVFGETRSDNVAGKLIWPGFQFR